MKDCICEVCNNKGWIETSIFDSNRIANGTDVIEKCDACNLFIDDLSATVFVSKNYKILSYQTETGFNIKIQFSLS